ncbi:hypothetical protein CLUG_00827 [Clavispora lusitaniae ATCC 42720]|uniref:U3 small nucleolar ribonucleoprotein protein MPP10 n=1 Tax=Clavispora lusitaniae (strain ATCC 42720) TaxID=306902 RepID=C4XY04_CLAL4|nr:uncharacterized protein CLUG_00827 [Clavispora lusitaniae ATCC 42720]EEQ36706.1 hypothetical protein CLUG_00827 [Clavispora lusitaniae ATCC 42720]
MCGPASSGSRCSSTSTLRFFSTTRSSRIKNSLVYNHRRRYSSVMEFLKSLAENPANIFKLAQKEETVEQLNTITKSLLDPIAKEHSVLDEIYVDGLDATQVFGQAQMVLSGVGEALLFEKIPELKEKYGTTEVNSEDDDGAELNEDEENLEDKLSGDEENLDDDSEEEFFSTEEPEDFTAQELEHSEDEENDNEEANDSEASEEENVDASDAESETTKVASDNESSGPKKDVFGLNDEFFDIDNFNKQIVALEDDGDDDEEEIDLFADLSDAEESEEQEMDYYDEFFDKPGQEKKTAKKSKKAKSEEDEELDEDRELDDKEYDQAVDSAMFDLFADEDEEVEKQQNTKQMSSFEKKQSQLQAEIAKLEAELVAEKKWTMKGEVRSKDRPMDSLLDDEEAPLLEFDRTSKPVPAITEEVTESIEDLIKRRIRNDEFDDLPKRLITDVSRFVQKQKTEVSEQKSEKSLAEIYEDVYHGVDPDEKITEELQAAHDEISDLMTSLNYKLDSLCSAHYIPKPHQFKSLEVKVTDAAASISLEDVQPTHVSDETKLAPQEVYKIGDDKVKADGAKGVSQVQLKSGLAYSKDELDRDDKQRLRRAKKRAKSKHFNELKEMREAREKQKPEGGDRKRQKVSDVIDTLSKAKNVTVIDKKGRLTDAKGNAKKNQSAPSGSNLLL